MIRQKGHLRPSKMIPSMVVSQSTGQELEAVRYLEFCIEDRGKGGLGNADTVIHNFLLSLYVKHLRGKACFGIALIESGGLQNCDRVL